MTSLSAVLRALLLLHLLAAAALSPPSSSSCPEIVNQPLQSTDGRCDPRFNTDPCGYDGGDCCEATCADGKFECADQYLLNRECEPGAQGAALCCAFPWTICWLAPR